MSSGDPHNLARFLEAQNRPDGSMSTYERACAELRGGRKESHWMWFIFPQIKGLGSSSMAARYAIASPREAEAYLQHTVLGSRLVGVTQIVNELEELAGKQLTAEQIFGGVDGMKFRSSMTLFAQVAPSKPVFTAALQKYFAGEPDPMTLDLLSRG